MKRLAGIDVIQAAERYSDRTAVIEGERQMTFQQLDQSSNALANWLRSNGCAPGEKVAVWLPNGIAVAECFLALDKGGYTRVSIDAPESSDFAQHMLEVIKPSALIADATLLQSLDSAWWPPITISVDGSPAGALAYDDVLAQGDVSAPGIEVDDESLYQIYVRFVAGSQILSVEHTRRNWHHEVARNQLLYLGGWYGPRLSDDEVFLNVQQLMHGTAIMGFYPFYTLGYRIVMLPNFEANATAKAIQDHHITTTFMVPGMVDRTEQSVTELGTDTRSLRRVLYGGAPLGRDALTRCIDGLGDALVQVYGRFDGAWPVSILSPADHRAMRDGTVDLWASCGKIAPFIETRIVDTNLNPVALGTPGEMVIRGDGVTPAAGLADGWCHTTDLVVEGPPTYLRIVGRTDDMINTGSYHVYPREIEEVLGQHSEVASVRVLGLPDPRWGEAVTAYVVATSEPPRPGLAEDLRSFCRERLSKYKAPKTVHFVEPEEVAAHGGLGGTWLKEKSIAGPSGR